MKTLDRKILRQIKTLKSQGITIALVVAAGVGIFIASRSAYDSLYAARENFYLASSFAQGFCSLKKAPSSLFESLTDLPGIGSVRTRIVREAVLDVPGETLPTSGRFVSLTDKLNLPYLRSGRYPKGESEVLLSEAFALSNKLTAGSSVVGILEGEKRTFVVTGIALSPEYVYIFRSGNPLPDDKHFGILWMDRKGMEDAFGMNGVFNDLIFNFAPDADRRSVLGRIDELLEPYGGLGSYDRDKLPSHSFLRDEFKQLRTMAYVLPMIFLGVAAFLLHIVSTRIISKEREQIATLKALGYSDRSIGIHYIKLISVIGGTGAALGIALGVWLGEAMTDLYAEFYRFPELKFRFSFLLGLQGILIGIASGILGASYSVFKILKLDPAQAMRPPIPLSFQKSKIEIWIGSFSAQSRMIFRNITRRPARTLIAILGVSTSVMIMVLGMFSRDAVGAMIEMQFDLLQRESVTVSFLGPVNINSVNELKNHPAVLEAEGYRMIPVRIRVRHKTKELLLQGIPENAELRRLVGKNRNVLSPPYSGIFLNSNVAGKLGIETGSVVRLELLEGNRKKIDVRVEGLVEELLGQGAYMELSAANRLLNEAESVNLVAVRTDSKLESDFLAALKTVPKISGVSTREGDLKVFTDTMQRSVLATTLILFIFASVISVGVVYNTAMISLSERAFELGSLRILGFTKAEVFRILAGELGFEILASLPVGCVLGYLFAYFLMTTVETEGFKVPLIISYRTYAIAVLCTLGTSALSYVVLYSKIKNMDLLSILKVRE
ncbi:FtsX-like permease family protein [Leptospira ellisii]|uniref:FtsX-like permease family protein n=1 Tax=Leptospira ellisii TaxID=2023197 RepID=A0AAE4TY61_9LEPT|nr:FtsX-like permease family protein [Leptospira ellisii]MDV6237773.1 FtsX-like permease family protein [Leptospira ellisii]